MATTKIHAIHVSPNRCISYVVNNKSAALRDGVDGKISHEKNIKTGGAQYHTLTSYLNCHEKNTAKTFHKYADKGRGKFRTEAPRTKNGKEVVAWHLIQNFKGHELSPQAANEIGLRLAREMFKGHAVVVSTHTDTENIHNHIVISAWNDDGRKWNNDNANYQKIRETSDKLCDEYKLNVLKETRKVKLVSYTDQEGNKRLYEPTERKDKIIKERAESSNTKNIDDYRRTVAHENKITKKEFDRDIIKADMDKLIPASFDYNDLMERLRSAGYIIKDKNKKGGWLKNITIIPPNETQGTRDNKIGDGTYYTRESLEKHFDEMHFGRVAGGESPVAPDKTDVVLAKGAEGTRSKMGTSQQTPLADASERMKEVVPRVGRDR